VDPAVIGLGVPQLHAEKSKDISTGITFRSGATFSAFFNFYHIKVKDRILFSGEVCFDGDDTITNPVEKVLIVNDITSMKFFINAFNTITKGVDIVLNYKNQEVGNGKLAFSLASNISSTKIDGQIATPSILKSNGYDIFNCKEQGRILSARPNTKVFLGINYDLNKASFIFNNTYFGDVTWQHATDILKDQTFAEKIIKDLGFAYKVISTVSSNVMVKNLFNVYQDELDTKGDVVTGLGGGFKYAWEVNQFGFSETTFSAGLNFKF
jgi:iron complex outermembrane receptor protein